MFEQDDLLLEVGAAGALAGQPRGEVGVARADHALFDEIELFWMAPSTRVRSALFARMSPDDLRFRFLTAVHHVDLSRICVMLEAEPDRTTTFLAFDGSGDAIAPAMIAADANRKDAEVAISVRSDIKGRGVGWSLLQHVLRYGIERGFENIRSIQNRQDNEVIALERDAGFEFHSCEGDPADVVAVKHLIRNPV